MEFKKKTIVWETNSEPPKNFLWVKDDGIYEYSNGSWQKSKSFSTEEEKQEAVEFYVLQVAQIVELPDNGTPATGTLTEEELEKLTYDNCVLKIGNTYFHKSYESENGLDYKPISMTSYMNGLWATYFTANKSTRQYTIARTSPIEANHQLDANHNTSTIRNIKVGNTTYAIPEILTVEGTIEVAHSDIFAFTPSIETIHNISAFKYAEEVFLNGGIITLKQTNDRPTYYRITEYLPEGNNYPAELYAVSSEKRIVWVDPNYVAPEIDN